MKFLIHTLVFFSVLVLNPAIQGQTDTTPPRPYLNDIISKHLENPEKPTVDSSGMGVSKPLAPGAVVIHVDPRIDSLEFSHRQSKIKGYRLQIFLGTFSQCRDERAKFHKINLEIPTYQVQNAPDYAVRVGDFRNMVEAMKALKEVKKYYPGAFMIKDEIEAPKLVAKAKS